MKNYLNIFPVPIQITELELNVESLIEFCYEMKRKDERGVEISNIGGWQSDNIFNETHPEFVKLKTEIKKAANVYHEEMRFKKTLKQGGEQIWANINQKGHSNEWHLHSRSALSGAFYLTGESPIVFQHPYHEITTYYWNSSHVEEWTGENSGEWTIVPKPNILLVFPAWVWHKVLMNKEDTDRISLSFITIFVQSNG